MAKGRKEISNSTPCLLKIPSPAYSVSFRYMILWGEVAALGFYGDNATIACFDRSPSEEWISSAVPLVLIKSIRIIKDRILHVI